jgi:hypothetical protein
MTGTGASKAISKMGRSTNLEKRIEGDRIFDRD